MSKITQDFYQAKSKRTIKALSFFVLLLMGTQMSWGQQVIDFGGYQLPAPYTNVYTTDADLQLALFGTSTVVAAPTSAYPPNPFTVGPAPYNLTFTASSATDARLYRSNPNLSGYSSLTNVVQNPSLTDYDTTGNPISNARNGRFQPNGSTASGANRFWLLTIPAGETVTFIIMSDAGAGVAPTISLSVDGATATNNTPANFKNLVPVAYKISNATGVSHTYKFFSPNGKLSLFRVYFGDVSDIVSPFWYNGQWDNGSPSVTREAFIGVAGATTPVNPTPSYSTTTNGVFAAKKLTVNTGNTLTVNSGTNVTVQNEVINNGTLVVENNANLIQVNNTTNTGNVSVKRNSNALSRLDYTIWSSPVLGTQTLAQFSPLTSQSPNRFYTYDTANNQYDNTNVPTTATFGKAAGYLVRMPNTDPTPNYDAGTATLVYPGVFTGVLNNGTISKAIVNTGSGYNMVGNPYSSTISADAFMTANTASIESTLYFWRKTNLAGGSAYATYTPLGGVGTNASVSGVILTPNGTIQVGQGFFVKAKVGATAVSFTNAMRETTPTSTQFFKTRKADQLDRVWLNLTNPSGAFSQALVGYTANATLGVDGYDGLSFDDSPVALTSNINGGEYTIQGRPAFDATDVVPLNFKTDVAGDYTIAIDHADGVFAAGQEVVLVDNTTGTETSLTTSSYSFTAAAGTANSRFSLKYQKTLGTNQSVFSDNNVAVYKNKGALYVNAGHVAIANIKVYDVQGKLVAELKNVKATSATIANLKATNQVLVVKITSQDNKVVTKKVMN